MLKRFLRILLLVVLIILPYSQVVLAESDDIIVEEANDNSENKTETDVVKDPEGEQITELNNELVENKEEAETENVTEPTTASEITDHLEEKQTNENKAGTANDIESKLADGTSDNIEGVTSVNKQALADTIHEAESVTSPNRAEELQNALNHAKEIMAQADATEEEIEEAEQILRDEIEFTKIISVKVNDLITIEHKGSYDEVEAQKMVDRVNQIPSFILDGLVTAGVEVKFISFPLTDMPEWVHLRGEVPRGWEGLGKTWDDVPGAGGNPMVSRIGYSEPGNDTGHGAINLELHEIAHVIDHYVFDYVSTESEEFLQIHEEEAPKFLNDDYHVTYAEEYFAQSFGYYYKNEQTKQELLEKAPKTYQFIESLVNPNNVNKDELANAIEKAASFEDELKEVLDYAKEVYNNSTATQEEIDEAKEKLLTAIDAMKQENEEENPNNEENNEGNNVGNGNQENDPGANNGENNDNRNEGANNNDQPIVENDDDGTNNVKEGSSTVANNSSKLKPAITDGNKHGSNQLPQTATNVYTLLLIGTSFISIGLLLFIYYRRKTVVNS